MNNDIKSVIIVAGGKGKRLPGAVNKQYIEMAGKPVILHTIEIFHAIKSIQAIILVLPKSDVNWFNDTYIKPFKWRCAVNVVAGGSERQESVFNGLKALNQKTGLVAVHDGVRPFVSATAIEISYEMAIKTGAAVVGVPVKDTIKQVDDNQIIINTPDRSMLWQVQTPQTFQYELLIKAHEQARKEAFLGTDDAMLVERLGYKVNMTMGSYENIKITTPDDLDFATYLLDKKRKKDTNTMRVGQGYDVHKLVAGRDLILGGVRIEHTMGLLGHSDADVLVHAIMDALLGAVGMRDIGVHFPDTDEQFKGADSLVLLDEVAKKLNEKGYSIGNIDATILAQKPKLSPHIEAMQQNIAKILKIDVSAVNIKATTTEKLGFEGREEGIAAQAIALIY